MAKIQAPKATKTEAPETEGVQAPDLSGLIQSLSSEVTNLIDGEKQTVNARVNMAVLGREAREEHGEALSRDDLRLAIQTAVAEGYGLKLVDVQNKPEKPGPTASKDARDKAARRNSCYTLVSELLSMAWPKDEKIDKAVAKALTDGEKRWVILKGISSKKQSRPESDPNAKKITAENLAAKLSLFVTQAQADIGQPLEEIFELVQTALDAMKAAPKE
jgi:hypothetical protein